MKQKILFGFIFGLFFINIFTIVNAQQTTSVNYEDNNIPIIIVDPIEEWVLCEERGGRITEEGLCEIIIIDPVVHNEIITCNFFNSDKEQRCYSDFGSCTGIGNCRISITAEDQNIITWKSSCGDYQKTIVDGNNKNIRFRCTEDNEVDEEMIIGRGFRNAYWQCYNGEESYEGDRTSCKESQIWTRYAHEFCMDKCTRDGSKCGVNTFSVSNECYNRVETPTRPIVIDPYPISEIDEFPIDEVTYPGNCILWFDGCNECTIKNNNQVLCTTADCEIYKEPKCLRYDEPFKSEVELPPKDCKVWFDGCNICYIDEKGSKACTEKYCEIHERPRCIQFKDEISLICKDSCPLDGKCYPFGYRKEGKFCSDKGLFIEQLNKDEFCENNFECTSNLCISGNCIEEGFFRRMMTWFKRMF